jgi:hypothetical protein
MVASIIPATVITISTMISITIITTTPSLPLSLPSELHHCHCIITTTTTISTIVTTTTTTAITTTIIISIVIIIFSSGKVLGQRVKLIIFGRHCGKK